MYVCIETYICMVYMYAYIYKPCSNRALQIKKKGKLEPCHYNFAKFEICHPDPHVIDSFGFYMSLIYRWHISNFAKL